ncbi:unnamed protein product [Ceutorhynchus assimilis]|uniref:Nuclear RNA export factor 2 n=1 Tax=Ceutorhynchus assimilis TaxID=467358 RepID=A0A9N9QMS8_9CUCU|nr:unnamed protein product [Ceutorhynchus assimilis]
MSGHGIPVIKQNADAVLVNDGNLHTGVLAKNKHLLKNIQCWHKFFVTNTEGLTRDQILKPILDQVHPLDLIPVFFSWAPQQSNFLARNCEFAIEKLCKDNLVVNNPGSTPFKLSIVLNYANTNSIKIDVQKNVVSVLKKRFDSGTRVLNLDRFHEDPDLTEFCPLSQPKIMYFVLHIAKGILPEVLILSNNYIRLLNPLDVLIGLKIQKIDLSYNKLSSMDDISSLKNFALRELTLNGNSLCNCSEDVYVSSIRTICPSVEILDDVLIVVDKFLSPKKIFLVDNEGSDMVNQFLEHFYTVYDSQNRRHLSGLYHSDAMFSLTCVYLAGQLTSGSASLKVYSNLSRNILKSADMSKTQQCLFIGQDSIMDVFVNKLPATEHDYHSFTLDLTHLTPKTAVFTITGVYKEKPVTLLDQERLLGFCRTFVLAIEGNKCVITNDQLHVYNGLTLQQKTSFLLPQKKLVNKPLIPSPTKPSDFADLVQTFRLITGLKNDWAKKFLQECSYDLKTALENFVDRYKIDKIPPIAFSGDQN